MRRSKPISLRMVFARNVRMVRIAAGLSQEELAHRCELDRTFIGSTERGARNLSIDNIERIATALQSDVRDLFNTNLAEERGYDVTVVRKLRGTPRIA